MVSALALECHYFAAGLCRSCTELETPRLAQVRAKQERVESMIPAQRWLEPVVGPDVGFRTKAKMVAGGTVMQPTLGILDEHGAGVDLQGCPLYPEQLRPVFALLAEFATRAALEPYDVPARRGELKHVVVTISPDDEVMVRWVLRSTEALARIRKHLPWLQAHLPGLAVASVNILPEHKAVLEGEQEIVLTEQETLPMRLGAVTLHLRPQSFFQTNTAVAAALYDQVAEWIAQAAPASVWDLYCGVGGFAFHTLSPGRQVCGVEVSEQAVASAQATAAELVAAGDEGALSVSFVAQDATEFVLQSHTAPEAVIVNPPRRGIGAELAGWLERSGVETVVYSSCNVDSLQRDLAAMPSYQVVEGRLLDMFPHTTHGEVAVLLQRV